MMSALLLINAAVIISLKKKKNAKNKMIRGHRTQSQYWGSYVAGHNIYILRTNTLHVYSLCLLQTRIHPLTAVTA